MKGIGYYIVQQEIADKAVAKERARQTRERARRPAREQARRPGLGRGSRLLSREEALNKIAKTHPRSAMKILQGYGIGVRNPVPERRGGVQ